jgi:hypothetical protein
MLTVLVKEFVWLEADLVVGMLTVLVKEFVWLEADLVVGMLTLLKRELKKSRSKTEHIGGTDLETNMAIIYGDVGVGRQNNLQKTLNVQE